MPYPFVLSTTSLFKFQSCLSSSTHPSLPLAATSQRAILRSTLKTHKRLSDSDQASNLCTIQKVLNDYLRYLVTLDLALSGKTVAGEEIDLALIVEPEVEWRPNLSQNIIPGRETERVKGRGLDFEIYFVLHSLAVTWNLIARQSLLGIYTLSNLDQEQRQSTILSATKSLKEAHSIHSYLSSRSNSFQDGSISFPSNAVDISEPVQSALWHLSHAEINLLGVLKDDPYPTIMIQSRNKDDRDWMIKAPEIPKMRTQVLRRLCVGAAEHATKASASLKHEPKKISKDLIDYCEDVRNVARAKACRFSAIDLDNSGQTGQAIGWIRAGMNVIGIEISKTGPKSNGLSKFKASWNERREDRKLGKGTSTWGADGGKFEESRILEHVDRKMTKTNDTINVQLIPEWKPLIGTLPTGMNIPIQDKWEPPTLDEDELAAMRAPPENSSLQDDDTSDEENENSQDKPIIGGFPGTHQEYRKGGEPSYY